MLQALQSDFQAISKLSEESLQRMAGKRLFLTGGTGFFGKWILGFLKFANERGLGLEVFALSRNPQQFLQKYPDFSHPLFHFVAGDIRSFQFDEKVDFVIHAATEASDSLNNQNPFEMFDVTVEGTKHLLRMCRQISPKRILLVSSGAVYGTQGSDVTLQPDDSLTAPDIHSVRSAYAEGKRVSELLGVLHAQATGQSLSFARCFAFVGPFLPLDTHFAIGNFIRDVLQGAPISIQGDGTACRSYMYASDLVIWLLRLLTHGEDRRSYNVGSEDSVNIGELAQEVARIGAEVLGSTASEVRILGRPGGPLHRYVPACERAQKELGLHLSVSRAEAIRKTFASLSVS